jgi:vacuolar-type H+-ATPase subunit I/STV1
MKFLFSCTSFIAVAILLSIGAFRMFPSLGSEKVRASVRVLQSNAESQLVSYAGAGDVAEQLMKNQYMALKERLVHIKTLKRAMERRIAESETSIGQLNQSGEISMAERQQQLVSRYRNNIKRLDATETAAEKELDSFLNKYRNFRHETRLLKEEIAVAKSIGQLSDDLAVDHPFNSRMEAVRELEEQLRSSLERAEALIEVSDLEADL